MTDDAGHALLEEIANLEEEHNQHVSSVGHDLESLRRNVEILRFSLIVKNANLVMDGNINGVCSDIISTQAEMRRKLNEFEGKKRKLKELMAKDLVAEMHKKVANYLNRPFDVYYERTESRKGTKQQGM